MSTSNTPIRPFAALLTAAALLACQPVDEALPEPGEALEAAETALMVAPLPPGSPTEVRLGIVSKLSGLCLDVAGVSHADGAGIQQWGCGGGGNQIFIPRHVGDGWYEVVASHSGKCLDVSGISTADGARLHQWSCWGGANQHFRLHHLGGGDYELRARHSDKCVTTRNWGLTNGTPMEQRTCRGTEEQRFRLNRQTAPRARALLVLMENGGMVAGLPINDGFLLPEFTCQGITLRDVSTAWDAVNLLRRTMRNPPVACLNAGNWVQTSTTPAAFAQRFVDFSSETIGRAFVESRVGGAYELSDVIEDAAFNPDFVREYLRQLSASYVVDIHVLAHGNGTGFGGSGSTFTTDVIRGFRDIPGLDLRAVYQQNCYGSALNAAWLDAGADVVSGTAGINYMPSGYGPFLDAWVAGADFNTAVMNAFAAERPAYDRVYRHLDLDDESNPIDLDRNPAEVSFTGSLSPAEELQSSSPIVQGAAARRIR
ncbi:RICIN domain-containing protein [Myxococcota bacterium]|nr:RICIN domain-containing protein [Myxococcota bacterium]